MSEPEERKGYVVPVHSTMNMERPKWLGKVDRQEMWWHVGIAAVVCAALSFWPGVWWFSLIIGFAWGAVITTHWRLGRAQRDHAYKEGFHDGCDVMAEALQSFLNTAGVNFHVERTGSAEETKEYYEAMRAVEEAAGFEVLPMRPPDPGVN